MVKISEKIKSFELEAYIPAEDEIKKIEAGLIEIRNDELTFQTKDKNEIILKFKDIINAKVLLSFS